MIFFLENENASYAQFHHIRKLLLTFLDICILRFMAGPWRVHWVLLLSLIKEKHLTDGQQVKNHQRRNIRQFLRGLRIQNSML